MSAIVAKICAVRARKQVYVIRNGINCHEKHHTKLVQEKTMAATVSVRLIIDIEYDLGSSSGEEVTAYLAKLPQHAFDNGLLSGNMDATVEAFSSQVEVLRGDGYETA